MSNRGLAGGAASGHVGEGTGWWWALVGILGRGAEEAGKVLLVVVVSFLGLLALLASLLLLALLVREGLK